MSLYEAAVRFLVYSRETVQVVEREHHCFPRSAVTYTMDSTCKLLEKWSSPMFSAVVYLIVIADLCDYRRQFILRWDITCNFRDANPMTDYRPNICHCLSTSWRKAGNCGPFFVIERNVVKCYESEQDSLKSIVGPGSSKFRIHPGPST